MSPHTTFALVLLLSQLRRSAAAVDFCDADPRVEVKIANCPGTLTSTLLLHIRKLDGNPYHSLHDSLWPVAHYIVHCVSTFPQGSITFTVCGGGLFNRSGCTGDKPLPPRGPYWGYGAVQSLAARVGGRVVGDLENEFPPGCFDKTVEFGVHKHVSKTVAGVGDMRDDFRAMSYFGRVCAGDIEAECDPSVRNRSMLIKMPPHMKGDALRYLRESMMRLTDASVPREEAGRKIRVLMYDRNDTSRRQWSNTAPIHQRLLKDSRVEVRFVEEIPKSLKGQVELYAWPDVLVSPHGAAQVNTVFMQGGTEVVEGKKLCDEYVGKDRFVPSDWTGWHAPFMNINVQYVQCHRDEGEYKEKHQLLEGEHGPPTNGRHKYRVEEVVELLETALERQTIKLRNMRRSGFGDPIGVQVKNKINSLGADGKLRRASRVSALVVGPLCLILLVMQRVVKTRRKPLRG